MKSLLVMFAILPSLAFADDWSTPDTRRESVYMVLHATDWAQTRCIARNGGQEQNRFLRNHPSRIDSYFALTALAHYGIARVLPADWRRGFQFITIGIQAGTVAHNYSIGISARF